MFKKILIANRGEIACRIIHTARKMGIKTIAVYSDADAHALHVMRADEAIHIGASPASESYLNAAAIIEAALETGAEAIHPGYGFLSENPQFVEAVKAAGLHFIGPSTSAIRAMGLKDEAKKLMENSGVPVVPGYHGDNQQPDFLKQQADKIAYPVLIKARAGGGGKGMKLVEHRDQFDTALESAMREARASFGDGHVLIEKFITAPRHIEIQVFGDEHGNIVHLFERDCSLQRRHQKVIEEAPAPGMTQIMREAMGAAALKAAKAVNYAGAGTVEFIVDGSNGLHPDRFWFMEMNTRLQVEHPVTEALTGLDLVELQLLVAAGEPLPFTQEDITLNGWAFEARLYAEDVPRGFLPATGTLDYLHFPTASTFETAPTRIDSGVQQGNEISPFYDPMIAKIITHAATREQALSRLARALSQCHIAGCVTNLDFLYALSTDNSFTRGEVDTGLIERHKDTLTSAATCPDTTIALAALISLKLTAPISKTSADPWTKYRGLRQWSNARYYTAIEHEGQRQDCIIEDLGDGSYEISLGGRKIALHINSATNHAVTLTHRGKKTTLYTTSHGNNIAIFQDGKTFTFTNLNNAMQQGSAEAGGDQIIAPMPGTIIKIDARKKASVAKGDALLVLEAMKMEHVLTAPRDGIIAEIMTNTGDQVKDGALLLRLAPDLDDQDA